MTWKKFWLQGEKFFDRFYTVQTTLVILKVGGYLSIGWTPIVACWCLAFVGALTCGILAIDFDLENTRTAKL